MTLHRGFMSGVERPPDIPQDVISSVYATNVMGVLNMTQTILPIFKRRSEGGRGDIIMLGSIAGREPYVGGTVSAFLTLVTRGYAHAREFRFTARVKLL